MRLRLWALLGAPLLLPACGLAGPAPTTGGTPSAATTSPGASASPQLAGTMRTVLTQLGLNVHAQPSTSAAVIGSAQEGTELTVLGYQAGGGGWFKVQGQTVTGWIVADPSLTAAGSFTSYRSSTHAFSALYPSSWTFAERADAVAFLPQQSASEHITVRTAPTAAAFGQAGAAGYSLTYATQEIVCGYTGALEEYQNATAATASAAGAAAAPAARFALIRLVFDAGHALELRFDYQTHDQVQVFADFYHSISFPYPLCQAQPPASPSPT